MISIIKKIITATPGTPDTTTSPDERNRLAACVLLLEAAHIDDDCTSEEMEKIIATMARDFSLNQLQVAELIELANTRREEATDLWQFTNHLNQHYDKEQKMAVMESVWRIIFADGRLDMHEDHFAHKLANLLRLSHEEMIAAKLNAKGKPLSI
jgi:uncharacterized tellurite resistance protein B-like protein